jgi:hypothetical protein
MQKNQILANYFPRSCQAGGTQLFPEFSRRDADDLLEYPEEIGGIGISASRRNLFDVQSGVAQEVFATSFSAFFLNQIQRKHLKGTSKLRTIFLSGKNIYQKRWNFQGNGLD